MITVLILILAIAVGVKLVGWIDLKGSNFDRIDVTRTLYHENGNKYRDDYLEAGQLLAKDLLDSNVDETKKLEIEDRLEQLRSEIRWTELEQSEKDMWFRIDSALRLRHIQEQQIRDIEAKRCSAISAASIKPDGTVTTSPVEVVCQ